MKNLLICGVFVIASLMTPVTAALAEEEPREPQTVAELFGWDVERWQGEPARDSNPTVAEIFGIDDRWTGETARDTSSESIVDKFGGGSLSFD